MRDEIRHLQQRLGLTVAYVTHDQSEALAVSDQIIVMEAGRIAQAGTPQQLYESPQSVFVAGFMGEAMLFDATAGAPGGYGIRALVPPRVASSWPVQPSVNDVACNSAVAGVPPSVSVTLVSSVLVSAAAV